MSLLDAANPSSASASRSRLGRSRQKAPKSRHLRSPSAQVPTLSLIRSAIGQVDAGIRFANRN